MNVISSALVLFFIFTFYISGRIQYHEPLLLPRIVKPIDISRFIPTTIAEVERIAQAAQQKTKHTLKQINLIKSEARNFSNTIGDLNYAIAAFKACHMRIWLAQYVTSSQSIRRACHQAILTLQHFFIDQFSHYNTLYRAYSDFKKKVKMADLTAEEKYTLQKVENYFVQNGLYASHHDQALLKQLKKQLKKISFTFNNNIIHAVPELSFNRAELNGLPDTFIQSQKIKKADEISIAFDLSTYRYCMENCTQEATRKKIWLSMVNRAYPENSAALDDLINIREQIAKISSFSNFAQLDIYNQMAKSPERVKFFLYSLRIPSQEKIKAEISSLTKYWAEKSELTVNNKIKPWDILRARNIFLKRKIGIDQEQLAAYFEITNTLSNMFEIFQSFFGITFTELSIGAPWESHIKIISAHRDRKLIGYLLLDIYSSEKQYVQPRKITLVPTCRYNSVFYPAFILIQLNLPAPQNNEPILLKQIDLLRLLHEFGHAIHALLGCTNLPLNSGSSVVRDFSEVPSKLLEEFYWHPVYLKKLSKHIRTGKPLSNLLVQKITKLRTSDLGEFVQRELYDSLFALEIFETNQSKNLQALSKRLYQHIMPSLLYTPEYHSYAGFFHLVPYGPKYYCYLWSKSLALEITQKLKQNNYSSAIGKRLIDTILSKGGSLPPEQLMSNFLGRKPTLQALARELTQSTHKVR